jgi:hypothetical protein
MGDKLNAAYTPRVPVRLEHGRIVRLIFTLRLCVLCASAPLRESILHAEAQRTQRLCTETKAVCVARRQDTSRAYAHALDGVA